MKKKAFICIKKRFPLISSSAVELFPAYIMKNAHHMSCRVFFFIIRKGYSSISQKGEEGWYGVLSEN